MNKRKWNEGSLIALMDKWYDQIEVRERERNGEQTFFLSRQTSHFIKAKKDVVVQLPSKYNVYSESKKRGSRIHLLPVILTFCKFIYFSASLHRTHSYSWLIRETYRHRMLRKFIILIVDLHQSFLFNRSK